MLSQFIKSSLITSVSYKNFKLLINFSNGHSYLYYNVPYEVYDELIKTDSAGKFYNQNIKGKFPRKQVI